VADNFDSASRLNPNAGSEWPAVSRSGTVYLLRSPKNAARLIEALERSERGEGIRMSPDELRAELGLVEQ
jgi:hypothetical protein